MSAKVDALDAIATQYDPSDPIVEFDYWFKRLQAEAVAPWLIGHRLLELGCATGELTYLLGPCATAYDVVEGSALNIDVARRRVPHAQFFECLWEDFRPADRYTDVIMFNALEHAEDPIALLTMVRGWLEDGGRIHIAVPNGLSIHRLVGVELGYQDDPVALNEGDRRQGHVRNYVVETLLADVEAAGLRTLHWEGLLLKFLSNSQMVGLDWPVISALNRVGRQFPHHCASLLVIAEAA